MGSDELAWDDVPGAAGAECATSSRWRPGYLVLLEVAALRTRLIAGEATRPGAHRACVPLAHLIECRADKRVVLDEHFILRPCCMHGRRVGLLPRRPSFSGLLHQRGEALAGRVAATGSVLQPSPGWTFSMLQVINRYEPLLAHYADSGALHPEELFRVCVSAAGELATFTATSKRPPRVPRLSDTTVCCGSPFDPVIAALRESLSKVLVQSAIAIPIEPRRFGISVAIVGDRSLYGSAVFILAARADLPSEELRRRFPAQLKIGPAEKIGDLVRLQLPGVPVVLPGAGRVTRQIPYHAVIRAITELGIQT